MAQNNIPTPYARP